MCFDTTAGIRTHNYLLVISSSQSYFNGLMPTTHRETQTSNSTSSVRAHGTATDSQGERWSYTATGTVDTTTTTTRTVRENVPYTDNDVSLYMQLYDSDGTILRQDSHLYSTRTGGDAANSFGYNLGNALAAIHARAGMLKGMVKEVERENRTGPTADTSSYCSGHPGEPWAQRSPAGAVLNRGTCQGEMSLAKARKLLIDNFDDSFKKSNVAGYAEIVGDNIIVHSERASAVRFGMVLHESVNSVRVQTMRQAGLKTWVYTNDADVNLTYDLQSSQIVAAGATPATSETMQAAAPDEEPTTVSTAPALPIRTSVTPAAIAAPSVAVEEVLPDKLVPSAPTAPAKQLDSDNPTPVKKKRVCIATMTFANGDEVCTRYAQDGN